MVRLQSMLRLEIITRGKSPQNKDRVNKRIVSPFVMNAQPALPERNKMAARIRVTPEASKVMPAPRLAKRSVCK